MESFKFSLFRVLIWWNQVITSSKYMTITVYEACIRIQISKGKLYFAAWCVKWYINVANFPVNKPNSTKPHVSKTSKFLTIQKKKKSLADL